VCFDPSVLCRHQGYLVQPPFSVPTGLGHFRRAGCVIGGETGGNGRMNRSIGDSVNRSRSRPGIALDGTIGAAAATEMPTVKTTLATQSCKAIVL
jgi:hypothetical protein